ISIFFNATSTSVIYTLSLHDALPISIVGFLAGVSPVMHDFWKQEQPEMRMNDMINFTKNMALAGGAMALIGIEEPWPASVAPQPDRKSTRLKSSHVASTYAVPWLKKK